MPKIVRSGPGQELEVITMRSPGKVVGTIAMPVRDHVNAATATSLMMTDWSFLGPDHSITRLLIQGSILTLQRNEAVQRMDGDWLLFIDDDMVWPPEAIGRLIQSFTDNDLDMLGGLCYRRSKPYQPTLYMRQSPTSGLYTFLEKWDPGIIEVDATGTAFLIVHKRVFEAIADTPMPPLEARQTMPPPNFFRWEGYLGEDLRFCQDAKTAGCRIWVDTNLEIGHVAEVTIGTREFLREMSERSAEHLEARRAANDSMGLPTLSHQEAMAKLEQS